MCKWASAFKSSFVNLFYSLIFSCTNSSNISKVGTTWLKEYISELVSSNTVKLDEKHVKCKCFQCRVTSILGKILSFGNPSKIPRFVYNWSAPPHRVLDIMNVEPCRILSLVPARLENDWTSSDHIKRHVAEKYLISTLNFSNRIIRRLILLLWLKLLWIYLEWMISLPWYEIAPFTRLPYLERLHSFPAVDTISPPASPLIMSDKGFKLSCYHYKWPNHKTAWIYHNAD